MSRVVTLLFAMIAYAIFFATFLYLIVFVGDLNLDPLKPATVCPWAFDSMRESFWNA